MDNKYHPHRAADFKAKNPAFVDSWAEEYFTKLEERDADKKRLSEDRECLEECT